MLTLSSISHAAWYLKHASHLNKFSSKSTVRGDLGVGEEQLLLAISTMGSHSITQDLSISSEEG